MCVKQYTIPPTEKEERSIVLEKGSSITIPIVAIHYDPKYFPEPDKFDPDRFSEENKAAIVSGSYMPFGVGPRNCIGKIQSNCSLEKLGNNVLCFRVKVCSFGNQSNGGPPFIEV